MVLKYFCRLVDLWWHHRWIYYTPHFMSHWPPQEKKDCSNRWFFPSSLSCSASVMNCLLQWQQKHCGAFMVLSFICQGSFVLTASQMHPEVLQTNVEKCISTRRVCSYLIMTSVKEQKKGMECRPARPRDVPSRNIGQKASLAVRLLEQLTKLPDGGQAARPTVV